MSWDPRGALGMIHEGREEHTLDHFSQIYLK